MRRDVFSEFSGVSSQVVHANEGLEISISYRTDLSSQISHRATEELGKHSQKSPKILICMQLLQKYQYYYGNNNIILILKILITVKL